jgi:hypothetical protein
MDELIIKRLAIVKHLYQQGLALSYEPEPTNGLCLLPFHDSIEMFMKICADVNSVKIDRNTAFMDYFSKLPNLRCSSQMQNLNNKRVALKHHGEIPSSLDIEIARTNTTEFFELNTPLYFDIEFSDISLTSLIKYSSVAEWLNKANDAYKKDEFVESICLSHVAFQELLLSHDEDKSYFYESPFSAVKECKHFFRDTKIDYQLDENIKKIKKDLLSIDDALTIIGLGIDYKQYTKFKLLSPYINIWPEKGGRKFEWLPKDNILANSRNASFCYDFVISCALNLQRSDFEIRELLKSPFPENKDEPGV